MLDFHSFEWCVLLDWENCISTESKTAVLLDFDWAGTVAEINILLNFPITVWTLKSLAGSLFSLCAKLSLKCRNLLLWTSVFQTVVFQAWRDSTEDGSCCCGTFVCFSIIFPLPCTMLELDASEVHKSWAPGCLDDWTHCSSACLLFVGPQYATCFMSPCWCLEFWGVSRFWTVCGPLIYIFCAFTSFQFLLFEWKAAGFYSQLFLAAISVGFLCKVLHKSDVLEPVKHVRSVNVITTISLRPTNITKLLWPSSKNVQLHLDPTKCAIFI